MKKTLSKVLILLVFLFGVFFADFAQASAANKVLKKELEVQTKDAHLLKATMYFPKSDAVKYPSVILLHSLGSSSENWGNLIPTLNEAGFLVVAMDLRGHGKSAYNAEFKQRSWTYFKLKTFQKYPSDVVAMIKQAQLTTKKFSPDHLAIIGADIGANTAILASKSMQKKPKALVLISPSETFKGLYVPIALTEIGRVSILSIACTKDRYSLQEQLKLSKFAQGNFYAKNYLNGGMGMGMIKVNPTMSSDIANWLVKVMK